MVVFESFREFRMNEFNLNWFLVNRNDESIIYTSVNIGFQSYPQRFVIDTYNFGWPEVTDSVLAMFGSGFSGSSVSGAFTGTVGILARVERSSARPDSTNWVLSGVSLQASEIIAAYRTTSTTDDLAWLQSVFRFGDLFQMSGSDDQIDGFSGDDTIYGNDGSDFLEGGIGLDLIYGGRDSDFMDGGLGADSLFGGAGDDIYVIDANDTYDDVDGTDEIRAAFALDLSLSKYLNFENARLLGSHNDSLAGSAFGNYLVGNVGDNHIAGNGGNDTLDGGLGKDTLVGGVGNDLFVIDSLADVIIDAGGIDELLCSFSIRLDELLFKNIEKFGLTGTGNFSFIGDKNSNFIRGNDGRNIINGVGGVDTIYGGTGNDTVYSGDSADIVYGGNDRDRLFGGNGVDTIYGGDANDLLYGGSQEDIIYGGKSNDTLYGGSEADILIGGDDIDHYFGGDGADVFKFNRMSEISYESEDVIRDFRRGTDKIDLSAIDASTRLPGNNKFVFEGDTNSAKSLEGEINYSQYNLSGTSRDYTTIWIDNDGDSVYEATLKVMGLHDFTARDFIL